MCFSSSLPKIAPPPPPPPPPLAMTQRVESPTRQGDGSASYKRRGTGALRTDLMVGAGNGSAQVNVAN